MLNEVYFLNVRLGKRWPNCNGGCKTENETYKTILEEVKGNEGRNDEVILIEIKRECINIQSCYHMYVCMAFVKKLENSP